MESADCPDIVLINLKSSTGRLKNFLSHNPALGYVRRFDAVDGKLLDRDVLVAKRIVDAHLSYSDGALGNALSHITQWERASIAGRPITVLEDDAVLCSNFRSESARLIAALPNGWDLVLWGYNFDTTLTFQILPGISTCQATFDQESLRHKIGLFHQAHVPSTAYRLVCALGTPGYTVSAGGAARLLAACVPLRQTTNFYPGLNRWLPDRSIDFRLNALHAAMATYVAVPPLVVTANDHAISTVQTPGLAW